MKYLILLFILTGCNSIDIKSGGVRSFILYQADNELESLGKSQLDDEFKNNLSMTYDEYQKQREKIEISNHLPTEEMVVVDDNYIIDNRGHLRLKRSSSERVHDAVQAKVSIPLRISAALSINNARVRLSIEDINLTIKAYVDGDIQVMLQWEIGF